MTCSDRANRILVVDDCPTTIGQVRNFLGPKHVELQIAHDESAGFIQAVWFRPGVVLIAMHLTGPVGLRLPNLLRRSPAADVPPIIAATGPDGPTARLAARVAGFDHFLPKPFDWSLLRGLLTGGRPGDRAD